MTSFHVSGCRCRLHSRRGALGLMAAVAALPAAACGQNVDVASLVPEETVTRMGLEAWAQIRQQLPQSGDPALQARLDALSARLLQAAGEDPANWEAIVFASPDANAFALPGNKIGVFEGMFEVAANDDQLAAVVGHEIGHLSADHSRERIGAQLAQDFGVRAVGAILAAGEVEYAGEIAAALGLGVQYGLVLPYSRQQELEADRLGLVTMNQAGFEPAEAVALWRRMEERSGQRAPAFLTTHPAPQERIEAIEAMLPQLQ